MQIPLMGSNRALPTTFIISYMLKKYKVPYNMKILKTNSAVPIGSQTKISKQDEKGKGQRPTN